MLIGFCHNFRKIGLFLTPKKIYLAKPIGNGNKNSIRHRSIEILVICWNFYPCGSQAFPACPLNHLYKLTSNHVRIIRRGHEIPARSNQVCGTKYLQSKIQHSLQENQFNPFYGARVICMPYHLSVPRFQTSIELLTR